MLLTDRHIARLWVCMGELFGHRWASSYGDKDEGTWLQGLLHVSPDQVAHGLGRVAESGLEWPPSLPEFRRMCIGGAKNDHGLDYVPQYYRKQSDSGVTRLANPATEATRKESLKTMRGLLPGRSA